MFSDNDVLHTGEDLFGFADRQPQRRRSEVATVDLGDVDQLTGTGGFIAVGVDTDLDNDSHDGTSNFDQRSDNADNPTFTSAESKRSRSSHTRNDANRSTSTSPSSSLVGPGSNVRAITPKTSTRLWESSHPKNPCGPPTHSGGPARRPDTTLTASTSTTASTRTSITQSEQKS